MEQAPQARTENAPKICQPEIAGITMNRTELIQHIEKVAPLDQRLTTLLKKWPHDNIVVTKHTDTSGTTSIMIAHAEKVRHLIIIMRDRPYDDGKIANAVSDITYSGRGGYEENIVFTMKNPKAYRNRMAEFNSAINREQDPTAKAKLVEDRDKYIEENTTSCEMIAPTGREFAAAYQTMQDAARCANLTPAAVAAFLKANGNRTKAAATQ